MNEEEIKALQKQVKQIQKEYDILDGIIDLKDAVIAKLKEENERLKEEIRQLHNGRTPEELYTLFGKPIKYWEQLEKENKKFTLEAKKLVAQSAAKLEWQRKTLQEIKEIIGNCCWDYTDALTVAIKDVILQKIAECEVNG